MCTGLHQANSSGDTGTYTGEPECVYGMCVAICGASIHV